MRGWRIGVCLVIGVGMTGCDRVGMTRARITAEFGSGLNMPPYPVEIAPELVKSGAVTENRVMRLDGGMELRQEIVVRAPIRIVPAEGGPVRRLEGAATQGAATQGVTGGGGQ